MGCLQRDSEGTKDSEFNLLVSVVVPWDISATRWFVRGFIVLWAIYLQLLRKQMLQLGIGSQSKGSKIKSGSKHILVFAVFFRIWERSCWKAAFFFTRSLYRSWISVQLSQHNWKIIWTAEKKGWSEAQKQVAVFLQTRAEQSSTVWTTSRNNNRRLWLLAVANGKPGEQTGSKHKNTAGVSSKR